MAGNHRDDAVVLFLHGAGVHVEKDLQVLLGSKRSVLAQLGDDLVHTRAS